MKGVKVSSKLTRKKGYGEKPLGKHQGMVPGEMLEPVRSISLKAQITSSPAWGGADRKLCAL